MNVEDDPPQMRGDEIAPIPEAIPLSYPLRWIAGLIFICLVGLFLWSLLTNKNMHWDVARSYMFNVEIMAGLGRTLGLTFLAMIVGLVLGIMIAIMRLSGNALFQSVSWAWVWFFRGVPPLVQLVFWYNLALLFPRISFGLPFMTPLASWDTNEVITPFSAAILGLSLTESGYAAEMIRGGIQAVSTGQTEAAASLGMTGSQTLRRIILPQALRILIPPIGNDTISMLKFTSLVSVLALPDLMYSAQMIYSRTYQTIPLLLVVTVWYLLLATLFTAIEHLVEKRMALGRKASEPVFDLSHWKTLLFVPFTRRSPQ